MSNVADVDESGFSFEQAANLPKSYPASMANYLNHAKLLRGQSGTLRLSKSDQLADFYCGSLIEEEARLAEVRSTVYRAFWGSQIFDTAFSEVPVSTGMTVRTIRLKLRQLGYRQSVSMQAIAHRASLFGLTTCPLFVAYHYRLRYVDQPLNEDLFVFTKPVKVPGDWSLFGLHHRQMYAAKDKSEQANILWLDGHYGDLDFEWSPDTEWVFALA